jgi:hypothetical protein
MIPTVPVWQQEKAERWQMNSAGRKNHQVLALPQVQPGCSEMAVNLIELKLNYSSFATLWIPACAGMT